MTEKTSESDKVPTVPSRQALYNKIAVYAPWAIEQLYELAKTAKNESVRASALNKIIDKCLPDIKAVELSGTEGSDIVIKVVSEVKDGNKIVDSQLPSPGSDIQSPSEN